MDTVLTGTDLLWYNQEINIYYYIGGRSTFVKDRSLFNLQAAAYITFLYFKIG